MTRPLNQRHTNPRLQRNITTLTIQPPKLLNPLLTTPTNNNHNPNPINHPTTRHRLNTHRLTHTQIIHKPPLSHLTHKTTTNTTDTQ
jgi:hypothetical protein